MKTIHVAAAIVIKEGKLLSTQRGYGAYKGSWEFPGGKVEPGETPEEALVRELREELCADIVVERLFTHVSWDYPDFHLEMDCFVCTFDTDAICLQEHLEARWLDRHNLYSVSWLAADLEVIEQIEREGLVR